MASPPPTAPPTIALSLIETRLAENELELGVSPLLVIVDLQVCHDISFTFDKNKGIAYPLSRKANVLPTVGLCRNSLICNLVVLKIARTS